MDNVCTCGKPKHEAHAVCDACYNETMLMVAEMDMEEANKELSEKIWVPGWENEISMAEMMHEPEHWSDMASFGDNGWE